MSCFIGSLLLFSGSASLLSLFVFSTILCFLSVLSFLLRLFLLNLINRNSTQLRSELVVDFKQIRFVNGPLDSLLSGGKTGLTLECWFVTFRLGTCFLLFASFFCFNCLEHALSVHESQGDQLYIKLLLLEPSLREQLLIRVPLFIIES